MPQRPVKAVMKRDVVTLRPEMTARDAERVLAEHRIGGAPVIDDEGRLLGVVSQSDLVRLDAAPPSAASAGAFFTDVSDYRDLERIPANESLVRVAEILQPRVLAIPPDAPLAEAAARMREHRVHRLLVIGDDRRLCGVVSAIDLLVALERPGSSAG